MEGPDIVVVARPRENLRPTEFTSNSSSYATGNRLPDRQGPGGTPTAPSAPEPEPGDIIVNVKVDDLSNLPAATEAAKRLALALASWIEELNALSPNQTVVYAGQIVSVTDAINIIMATEWVVTDRTFSDLNGGVGAAITEGGILRDYINFNAISPSNPNSYAAPGYMDNEGMLFIVMHEIAHLSAQGQAFRALNISRYTRLNNNSTEGYNNSEQFRNVERWSNDVAAGMMKLAFEFGLGRFVNPKYGYGASLMAVNTPVG